MSEFLLSFCCTSPVKYLLSICISSMTNILEASIPSHKEDVFVTEA